MTPNTRYITLVLSVPYGDPDQTDALHTAFRDHTPICGLKACAIAWGDALAELDNVQADLDELREKRG